MRTVFTLMASLALAGCGEISLRQKNGSNSPSLFQAALQLGVEGLWQISDKGKSGSFVVEVASSKVSFDGHSFSEVVSGGEGIVSNATLLGVAIEGDQSRGPHALFLFLNHGQAGISQCGPDGCSQTQEPQPPFRQIESHAITAVSDSTLTLAGAHPNEGGAMTRLAAPTIHGDALTIDSVVRDLSGMWKLKATSNGYAQVVVLGTTKISFEGTNYFQVLAGGRGFSGNEILIGMEIDQVEGSPKLRLLWQGSSGERSGSVDVLAIFDDALSLGELISGETLKMLRL